MRWINKLSMSFDSSFLSCDSSSDVHLAIRYHFTRYIIFQSFLTRMYLSNAFLKLADEKVTSRSETAEIKMLNAVLLVYKQPRLCNNRYWLAVQFLGSDIINIFRWVLSDGSSLTLFAYGIKVKVKPLSESSRHPCHSCLANVSYSFRF